MVAGVVISFFVMSLIALAVGRIVDGGIFFTKGDCVVLKTILLLMLGLAVITSSFLGLTTSVNSLSLKIGCTIR